MQVTASRQGNDDKHGDAEYADAVYRTSVIEAARDLAVVEALLQSSQEASQVVHVVRIPSKVASKQAG